MIVDFLSNKKITEAGEKSWTEKFNEHITKIISRCYTLGSNSPFYHLWSNLNFCNNDTTKKIKKRLEYWAGKWRTEDECKIPTKIYSGMHPKKDNPVLINKKENYFTFTLYGVWINFDICETYYVNSHRSYKLSNGMSCDIGPTYIAINDVTLKLPLANIDLDNPSFDFEGWFLKTLDDALCEQIPVNEIYEIIKDRIDDYFLNEIDN